MNPPAPLSAEQAYQRLANLCARSEHCPADIERKLQLWHIAEDEAADILARLCREGYVDTARYARAFAHDKFQYNHWGPQRISNELFQRHIPQADIREALALLPAEAVDDTLTGLLSRKLESLHANSSEERFLKLLRYAAGKGYTYEDIRRCLERMGQKEG